MYRFSRSHCKILRLMLWQPSDIVPITASGYHHVSELEQQQYRPLTSMLFTKLRCYAKYSKETFLRKMTTATDYDPWKPPKVTTSSDGGSITGSSGGGGVRGFGGGTVYSRHPDDPTDDGIAVEDIQRLINKRNHARRNRDFMIANRTRTQLITEYGVVLNDQERTWSTNPANVGRNKSMNYVRVEDFGPTGHDYKRAENAGKSISPLPEDLMHELIAERRHCKLNRNFRRADEIQQQLNDMHVQLCDDNKLWRSDGKRFPSGVYDYSYAPEAGPMTSSMPEEQILALLRERLACRLNRDFTTADAIRTELEAAGVYVLDIDRIWRADGIPFDKKRMHRREDLGET